MSQRFSFLIGLFVVGSLAACNSSQTKEQKQVNTTETASKSTSPPDTLPRPYATPSARNMCTVIGWPEGKTPLAPPGFTVEKFADGLENPRWLYITPNGDVLVSEANSIAGMAKKAAVKITGKLQPKNYGNSANRITLFRDTNKDGKPDLREIFLEDLSQPFGMLVLDKAFYVANTDGVLRFPYQPGQTRITGKGAKILELPAGGYNNHWTRNIIANQAGTRLYVSVGSGSNVGENGMKNEVRRANILELNPDGSGERIYAAGLRNPVGMDWAPGTNILWTAVNERDGLGDDLVPDYLTGLQEGGFYGWPYAYFGANPDPRLNGEHPELVQNTLVPDVALGAHTASLGLAFYNKQAFPEKYRNGAFIGQHGSWNRSELVGYKVVFVPFRNGKPSGKPEDFLTGFIADAEKSEVYGRPVCVAVMPDGALLVTDDSSNTIWRVAAKK
jgi:glucose/arabinose dehydrogenase